MVVGAISLLSRCASAVSLTYTGRQYQLSVDQTLGKIACHIDIGVPETFSFLANERAPAWDILNNLAAECLIRRNGMPL